MNIYSLFFYLKQKLELGSTIIQKGIRKMDKDAPRLKFMNSPQETEEFKKNLQNVKQRPPIYQSIFHKEQITTGLTFDDLLLIPQYGEIDSRSQCNVKSKFSTHIPLNLPIVSAPMDTVTESEMATQMARQGGLGTIHRFMSIQDQAFEVEKVKRSGVFINVNPMTIPEMQSYKKVKELMEKYNISSFLVVGELKGDQSPRLKRDSRKILKGILTNRDINAFQHNDDLVKDFMTGMDKMIFEEVEDKFRPDNCDLNAMLEKCKIKLVQKKVQKIPLLSQKKQIIGLVCLKDILRYESMGNANKDQSGRLFVGAAVGANKDYIERSESLIKSGCDVLIVDVANGHSKLALTATQDLKQRFPTVDVVAGSVATGEGAEHLIRSGADGIRCGIGNGSICITRIVAGSGVPQLSALKDTYPVCSYYDIPLCSDGGLRNSGNMCKALAFGADSIMVGRLLAGCQESPGISFNKDGKFVKVYRGMAGLGANMSKTEKTGGEVNPQTFNAEGVEGYIPYTGPLKFVIQSFANGIKSGMSYTGAENLKQLKEKAKFVQMTNAGFKESNVHGVNQFG